MNEDWLDALQSKRYKDSLAYNTSLSDQDEEKYKAWILENGLTKRGVLASTMSGIDYDMRGYWKALSMGDPVASQSLNTQDGLMHFPDKWKKPSHSSFSNQSIYAVGKDAKKAGKWTGEAYTPGRFVDLPTEVFGRKVLT